MNWLLGVFSLAGLMDSSWLYLLDMAKHHLHHRPALQRRRTFTVQFWLCTLS